MNEKFEKMLPKINFEYKNLFYAKLLLNAYSGVDSEDTAIHTYTYQYIILKKINKKLSDDILKISMTEMHHLCILGEMIFNLGGNPFFKFFDPSISIFLPWSGNYVDYSTNVDLILKNNILLEYKSINYYKKCISCIKDQNICNVLLKIIDDEYEHIKLFKSYLNEK